MRTLHRCSIVPLDSALPSPLSVPMPRVFVRCRSKAKFGAVPSRSPPLRSGEAKVASTDPLAPAHAPNPCRFHSISLVSSLRLRAARHLRPSADFDPLRVQPSTCVRRWTFSTATKQLRLLLD
eukprot:4440408-Pleurochrysis_carterae.AAC.4